MSDSPWSRYLPPLRPIPQQVQASLPPNFTRIWMPYGAPPTSPSFIRTRGRHLTGVLATTPRASPAPTQGGTCLSLHFLRPLPWPHHFLSSLHLSNPGWLLPWQLLRAVPSARSSLPLPPTLDLCLAVSSPCGAIWMIWARISWPL